MTSQPFQVLNIEQASATITRKRPLRNPPAGHPSRQSRRELLPPYPGEFLSSLELTCLLRKLSKAKFKSPEAFAAETRDSADLFRKLLYAIGAAP